MNTIEKITSMKKFIYTLGAILFPMLLFGQTTTENYVKSTVYKRATLDGVLSNDPNNTAPITHADKLESIMYFDGLGRPLQSIASRAGGTEKDIIVPFEYDFLGRQTKEFLPYVNLGQSPGASSLNFRNSTSIDIVMSNYYQNKHPEDFAGLLNPYSEILLEASPNPRTLKKGAPGADWTVTGDHAVEFEYFTNDVPDQVRFFRVDHPLGNTEEITLVEDGFYNSGTLYKNITKDENWQPSDGKNHTKEEFMNNSGQVILTRSFNGAETLETYYVYDRFGNLTYVIPPLVNLQDGISADELEKLCYQNKYDKRNRLSKKKEPGKGWEYILYDQLDRVALTQDARLRAQNQWLFTKYDIFGRIVYTGILTTTDSLEDVELSVTESDLSESRTTAFQTINGTEIFYTSNVYPDEPSEMEVLTVNYYDDYNIGNQITYNPVNGGGVWEGMSISLNTQGLATVTRVKVLGTNDWTTTAIYYDEKGRAWETHVKNEYLNTDDWELNKLDFFGNVEKTFSTHTKDGATISITDNYTYDHSNRLLEHKQSVNNQAEELIVSNTYDGLGQLIEKGVGGKVTQGRLQNVDLKYNVRGWLKEINNVASLGSSLFGFKVNYNAVEGNVAFDPQYNGNISQTIWKTASVDPNSGASAGKRGYTYRYDPLGRITNGVMRTGESLDVYTRYHLRFVEYDKNGNITELQRDSGAGIMDVLDYQYDGNRLLSVTDTAPHDLTTEGFVDGTNTGDDYTYDINGNMTSDTNNGIVSISYNHLNLPTQIVIANNGMIRYVYDARGNKLVKLVTEYSPWTNTTTNYAGNYIYENNVLQFFSHPEGYVKVETTQTGAQYSYVYQYTDHLGNIRLSYSDLDGNGSISAQTEILEENNYYPFGLKHQGYNSAAIGDDHKYGFNGVEETSELGLNLLEMKMRHYDPTIARWVVMDPVIHHDYTPYQAFDNNPVFWIDPSGANSETGGDEDDSVNGGVLDPVYITNKPTDRSGMPAFLRFNVIYEDWTADPRTANMTLDEYNLKYGTDFSYDSKYGSAWSQWYYDFYYKPKHDEIIASMHEATGFVAGIIFDVMLTVAPGGNFIRLGKLGARAGGTLLKRGFTVKARGEFLKGAAVNVIEQGIENDGNLLKTDIIGVLTSGIEGRTKLSKFGLKALNASTEFTLESGFSFKGNVISNLGSSYLMDGIEKKIKGLPYISENWQSVIKSGTSVLLGKMKSGLPNDFE
jgi:RHS repeat-associated protein